MSSGLSSSGLAYCVSFASFYALNVFALEFFQTKQEIPIGQIILVRGSLIIWVIGLIYAAFPYSRESITRGFDLAFGTAFSVDDDGRSTTENTTDKLSDIEHPQWWIFVSTSSACVFGLLCWLICLKEMSSGDMILILEVSNTIVSILYAMFWLRERINPVSMICFVGILAGLTIMLRPTFLFGPERSDDGESEEKDFRNYSFWDILCALGVAASFFISDVALYRFRDKVQPMVLTLARLWQEIAICTVTWLLIWMVFGMDEAWHSITGLSPLPMTILWMFAPLEVFVSYSLVMALTSVPFYFFNCMGSLTTLLCYLMDVWLLNEVEHWTVYAGASIIVCSLVFLTCDVDDDSHSDSDGTHSDFEGYSVIKDELEVEYERMGNDQDVSVVV